MPTRKEKKPRRHGNTEKEKLKNSLSQIPAEDGLPATLTLLDLRGSVPVSGPQDFDDIRKQVREIRYSQKINKGKE
jgi:hypothetical protein